MTTSEDLNSTFEKYTCNFFSLATMKVFGSGKLTWQAVENGPFRDVLYMYLVPETSTLKYLFQLDDSKSLDEKLFCFTKHPLESMGCLGFQVFPL